MSLKLISSTSQIDWQSDLKNLYKVGQSDWFMLFWDSHCHFCVQYASDSRWAVSGRAGSITLLLCPSLRHVCPWLNFPFLLMMCSETDPWQDRGHKAMLAHQGSKTFTTGCHGSSMECWEWQVWRVQSGHRPKPTVKSLEICGVC